MLKQLKSLRQQSGITLTETMLVAVISMMIITMGIQQYQSYKRDSDVSEVVYNVNQILQAAGFYYQANCRNQFDATTNSYITGSGALDPANNPSNPTVVDVYTGLWNTGYLKNQIKYNPLVYTTVAASTQAEIMKAYVVQFNLTTPQAQRTIALSDGTTANVGNIYVWRVQVSVLLRDSATAQQYLKLLGGDCLSRLQGSQVLPCPAVPTAPTSLDMFVVYERLPSMTSASTSSGLEPTNASVNQFNQQYTTYPMLYLTGSTAASTPQNYLCGT